METCPIHARIVLMSTPDRKRCVAVEWRIVCGLTRFLRMAGTFFDAAFAWRSTIVCTPNRVMGWPERLRNRRSVGVLLLVRGRSSDIVLFHRGTSPPLI